MAKFEKGYKMTIYEINKELDRLMELRNKMLKEASVSDYKDYIGKYYKKEFCIGKIFITSQSEIKTRELYFDDDNYEIQNDIEYFDANEIQVISKEEFEEILNSWIDKIKDMYGLLKEK